MANLSSAKPDNSALERTATVHCAAGTGGFGCAIRVLAAAASEPQALGVEKMMKDETQIEVPQSVKENWQEIVNILSKIVGVPAALIMREDDHEIEVFVSSKSAGNPYRAGDKEHFRDSGRQAADC